MVAVGWVSVSESDEEEEGSCIVGRGRWIGCVGDIMEVMVYSYAVSRADCLNQNWLSC